MPEWQPIATAPKDGTPVLLWAPHWDSPRIGWTFANDPWQDCARDTWKPERAPTHWMRLPAPPPKAIEEGEN